MSKESRALVTCEPNPIRRALEQLETIAQTAVYHYDRGEPCKVLADLGALHMQLANVMATMHQGQPKVTRRRKAA